MLTDLKKFFWKLRLQGLSKKTVCPTKPDKNAFLFFSNETEIQPFYKTLIQVAHTVAGLGRKIKILGCCSHLPFCGVHLMHSGLKMAKESMDRDCYRCMRNSFRKHPRSMELLTSFKENLILKRSSAAVIKKLTLLNVLKVKACIPGGQKQYMKTGEFKILEKAGQLAFCQAKEAIIKGENNTFVHINNYSLSLCARQAAREANLRCISLIHASLANNSPENILVNQRIDLLEMREPAKIWGSIKSKPIPNRIIKIIFDDLQTRLGAKGTHTWSPIFKTGLHHLPELIQKDAVSKKPVILAFTSSQDERNFEKIIRKSFGLKEAPEHTLFATQNSWLIHLARWSHKHNITLWIRIHPRNRLFERKCLIAKTAKQLERKFNNVRCIDAENTVSTYNLIEFADLGVYGWSSMGLESACLGLPVISYQRDFCLYPPHSIGPYVTNLKNYEKNLFLAIKKKGLSNIISAWRVSSLVNLGNAIHIRPEFLRNISNREIMHEIFIRGISPLKFYSFELEHTKLSNYREKIEIKKRMNQLLSTFLSGPKNAPLREMPDSSTLEIERQDKTTQKHFYEWPEGRDVSKGARRIQAFLSQPSGELK